MKDDPGVLHEPRNLIETRVNGTQILSFEMQNFTERWHTQSYSKNLPSPSLT